MKAKLLKKVRKDYHFELEHVIHNGIKVQVLSLMANYSEFFLKATEVKDNDITAAKRYLVDYLIQRLRIQYPKLGYWNRNNQLLKIKL